MAVHPGYSSIADSSKPNAGRLYDFLLGGNHNFEVDRAAAEQLVKVLPLLPKAIKHVRWFLGEAVRRLTDEGFRHFLDFASGLPTVDHIHQVAPAGTKVIYSDLDPVTVSYGREIIKDLPNARYVHCDAGTPEKLLESGVVQELFGAERTVAVGFNGIAWFLPDEEIAHSMQVLYDWTAPGSKLYLTTEDTVSAVGGEDDPRIKAVADMYRSMGQPFYPRTRKRLAELVAPWRLLEPGFRVVEEWVEIGTAVSEQVKREWGGGGLFGAFFER
jgi:hypothetical protein